MPHLIEESDALAITSTEAWDELTDAETDAETDETETMNDAEIQVLILRMKLKDAESGFTLARPKYVATGLLTFYSDVATHNVVNVYESWQQAYRRAQVAAQSELIAELRTQLLAAQNEVQQLDSAAADIRSLFN